MVSVADSPAGAMAWEESSGITRVSAPSAAEAVQIANVRMKISRVSTKLSLPFFERTIQNNIRAAKVNCDLCRLIGSNKAHK